MDNEELFFNKVISLIKSEHDLCESKTIYLQKLKKSYWTDLTASTIGFFSFDDSRTISELAAQKLADSFRKDSESLDKAWIEVVRDFHRNNAWGFQRLKKKPKIENKQWTEMAPFIWIFVQAALFMKMISYFFGMKSTEDPDSNYGVYFVIAMVLSFSSAMYFAWRQHQKRKGREWD